MTSATLSEAIDAKENSMATLEQMFTLRYQSPRLKARVTAALAKAAHDVLNEAATVANHSLRVRWARAVLADAPSAAERMMWAVVQNPTIQTQGEASTDNDIQFVVNSHVDLFARGTGLAS